MFTDLTFEEDLCEVGIFGWAWHGLVRNGVIESEKYPSFPSKAHPQPVRCQSLLIDKGLPEIVRTAEEIARDDAYGHDWRNYLCYPRSYVYGQALAPNADDQSFLHVDEAGQVWRVILAYSITLNTVHINATVSRHGLFTNATLGNHVYGLDVACENILDIGLGNYIDVAADLQDVWTNGVKALIGINGTQDTAQAGDVRLRYRRSLNSLIELTLSGTANADGSGLTVAATEIKPNSTLNTSVVINTVGTWDSFAQQVQLNGCTNLYDGPMVHDIAVTIARYAYYDAAGVPIAARMKQFEIETFNLSGGSSTESAHWFNQCSAQGCTEIWGDIIQAQFTQVIEHGVELYENDTLVDRLTFHGEYLWESLQIHSNSVFNPNVTQPTDPPILPATYCNVKTVLSEAWSGALSALINAAYTSANFSYLLIKGWQYVDDFEAYWDEAMADGTLIGVSRFNYNSAALSVILPSETAKHFGTIMTPGGNVFYGTPTAGSIYLAINRKTAAYVISDSKCAYV